MTDKSLGTFINPFTNPNLKSIYADANEKLNKLANMNYEDRHAYELSLKYYRDFLNVVDTAKSDGIEIGIEQGKMLEKIEMAKAMLQKGFEIEVICQITGLSAEIISR